MMRYLVIPDCGGDGGSEAILIPKTELVWISTHYSTEELSWDKLDGPFLEAGMRPTGGTDPLVLTPNLLRCIKMSL